MSSVIKCPSVVLIRSDRTPSRVLPKCQIFRGVLIWLLVVFLIVFAAWIKRSPQLTIASSPKVKFSREAPRDWCSGDPMLVGNRPSGCRNEFPELKGSHWNLKIHRIRGAAINNGVFWNGFRGLFLDGNSGISDRHRPITKIYDRCLDAANPIDRVSFDTPSHVGSLIKSSPHDGDRISGGRRRLSGFQACQPMTPHVMIPTTTSVHWGAGFPSGGSGAVGFAGSVLWEFCITTVVGRISAGASCLTSCLCAVAP